MTEQSQAQPQATSFKRGYVKQVLSGDAVVLQVPTLIKFFFTSIPFSMMYKSKFTLLLRNIPL